MTRQRLVKEHRARKVVCLNVHGTIRMRSERDTEYHGAADGAHKNAHVTTALLEMIHRPACILKAGNKRKILRCATSEREFQGQLVAMIMIR